MTCMLEAHVVLVDVVVVVVGAPRRSAYGSEALGVYAPRPVLPRLAVQPSGWDWSIIKANYETKGALIYSSEWVGWVPVDDCGKGPGNLGASHYKVSNLQISGSVVQGPTPRSCGGSSRGHSPSPSPMPAPSVWQPCSTGPCCNPYASVAQLCPGQIACKECGGCEACQCPTTAKEAMHEALVLI